MQNLPDVTLCCIDTRCHSLAIDAIRRCMRQCRFGRVLFVSDAQARQHDLAGIELLQIDGLRSIDEYSRFVIKNLRDVIHTSHVLLIQWDGFIIHPSSWDESFLAYDYIGAPWVHGTLAGTVGNGGFSLRSRRLLDALADPTLQPSNPEDLCICVDHRACLEQAHGIRFAPLEVAARFAYERGEPAGRPFGFHGVFNFDQALNATERARAIAAFHPQMAASADARHLVKRLIKMGDAGNALRLLDKRAAAMGPSWDLIQLRIRARLAAT